MERFASLFMTFRTRVNKHPFLSVFIIGGVIGTLFFLIVCGWKILNPLYTDWIVAKEDDVMMPYFAQLFWLRSSGGIFDMISGMDYPYEVSPVFQDINIPIAGTLKMLSRLFAFPKQFQTMGIATLCYYVLQGGCAALLFKRFTSNIVTISIGSYFFCIAPWLSFRIFHHYTLGEQCLLLLGLILWLYRDCLKNKACLYWCLLIPFSAITHLYFIPMLMLILLCDCLEEFIESHKWLKSLITCFVSGVISLLLIYLFGGFNLTVNVPDDPYDYVRLGWINSNLNTFVNPLTNSLFLKERGVDYVYNGQYEGSGYLGLGLLLILFIDVFFIILKWEKVKRLLQKYKVRAMALTVCFILFCMVAVGFKITIGSHVIADIPVPEFLQFFLATFRSIGRFIWIPCYFLTLFSILAYVELGKEIFIGKIKMGGLLGILLLLCIVQTVDLSPMLSKLHQYAGETVVFESLMKSEKWLELAENHDLVCVIPSNRTDYGIYSRSIDDFVIDNDMAITSFLTFHTSALLDETAAQMLEDVKNGEAYDNAIYWFRDEISYHIASEYLHCEELDGYYIGWVE